MVVVVVVGRYGGGRLMMMMRRMKRMERGWRGGPLKHNDARPESSNDSGAPHLTTTTAAPRLISARDANNPLPFLIIALPV